MTIQMPSDEALLRADLLERMRRVRPVRTGGFTPRARNAFTYGCKLRETLKSVQVEKPALVVVMRGSKEVWVGDRCQTMPTGSVFVLPRGLKADFVNVPDESANLYESLLMEVDGLPASVPRLAPAERLARRDELRVPLTRDLVEALGHAATSLSAAEGFEAIRELRVAEILMLLRHVPEARPLFEQTLAEDASWLIRSAPAEDWTVESVAGAFGIAGSTLRRRLSGEGTSFREVLREVRMEVARVALAEGAGSVAAAEAAGYASRSHFARAYRAAYGETPTGRK
jgi:AraC-like DNA-binding protein